MDNFILSLAMSYCFILSFPAIVPLKLAGLEARPPLVKTHAVISRTLQPQSGHCQEQPHCSCRTPSAPLCFH